MNDTLTKLKEAGCDIDGSMERFLNDEEFYLECYRQAMVDGNFDQLGVCLKAENVQEAFECAHALKGVLANMGITPLYDLVVEIVETLRAGKTDGLMPVYEALMAKKVEFQNMAE